MDVNDVSIFEQILQAKKEVFGGRDVLNIKKIYFPLNEAMEQLLEMLNEERNTRKKIKTKITFDMFKRFELFESIISNHIEGTDRTLAAFAFVSRNSRIFSIDEEEGIITVDGIRVLEKLNKFDHYKLEGILITDLQYEDLIYWAQNGQIKKDKIRLSEKEAETMIDGNSYDIGTDIKVIRDLIYNYPQKRWLDYAELEFQFYGDLRRFLSQLKDYVLYRIRENNFKYEETEKNNLQEILDMVTAQSEKLMKNLETHKVCYNKTDWIDLEDINDIPLDEYIRFANGACWAVESVIEFFQRNKGFNRAPNVKGYPTRTLFNKWAPEVDREHLFEHPIAKQQKLREWYEQRNLDLRDNSKIISQETMRVLKEQLEILASRGPSFVDALRRELPREALDALRKAGGEIEKTGKYQEQIVTIINELLKSQAAANLVNYIEKLSEKERLALEEFEPNLIPILTSCSKGTACVWYTADIVRNAYNDVAEVKGIEKIFTGKSKFEHVTPTKIEF